LIAGGKMSSAVRRTCEIGKALREENRPWPEVLSGVRKAGIRQGDFEPLYAGCEQAPYRIRFIPRERPQVFSREFVEGLTRLAEEHSLVVQTRCTGYNLFLDTGKPNGLYQRVKKTLGLSHKTGLLRVFWLDTYEIELEHPELAGMPEALEKIGSQLYGLAAQ
jgi:hypothetical protein